jgi:transposase
MSDRFEHTLDSKADDTGETGLVRRIELITGAGRRRRWSMDAKARILVESLKPGANVSEVARRYGLSPQQLFGWRRQARALIGDGDAIGAAPSASAAPDRAPQPRAGSRRAQERERPPAREPAFAPVVIAASAALQAAASASPPTETVSAGCIEIAIGDCVVRVASPVETALLIAVLRAVRRAS